SGFQSLDCCANRFAIRAIPFCRERVDRAQKESDQRNPVKLRHGHPIDFSAYRQRYKKRIEMTDVVCRQQKSPAAIVFVESDHLNPRDTAKDKSYHQLTRPA